MLTIRVDNETAEMIAYLRRHKVRFQPKIRQLIKPELQAMCKDFKRKENRIPNAPDWVYED